MAPDTFVETDHSSPLRLRRALPQDAAAISECVNAAYAHWIPRIGRKPWPMLQEYSVVVRTKRVVVAEERGELVGVLVLDETREGFLVENVAVLPFRKGHGVGRTLLVHAEHKAKESGYSSLYLFTNELMSENIALYEKIGYVEYARRNEEGIRRVYLRKALR